MPHFLFDFQSHSFLALPLLRLPFPNRTRPSSRTCRSRARSSQTLLNTTHLNIPACPGHIRNARIQRRKVRPAS